jgi:heme o synthase
MQEQAIISRELTLKARVADFSQLVKFRLTFTVVLSAVICFLMASESVDYTKLIALTIGGFFVVGSANGINQIIERNFDKLMTRTSNRPIAAGRMSVNDAAIFCSILGITGVLTLGIVLNTVSAALGLFALLSYAFAYTPLKRVSPLAVLVGAFPGAVAPMLGWVAVTGEIDKISIVLFAVQFFWQFPHFWSIAWILDDDYRRAGYQLLPSTGGRDRKSAFQSFLYALVLIPVSLMPWYMGVVGNWSALVTVICGVIFLYQGLRLLITLENKEAKRLMFYSFLYLPVVLLSYLADKI